MSIVQYRPMAVEPNDQPPQEIPWRNRPLGDQAQEYIRLVTLEEKSDAQALHDLGYPPGQSIFQIINVPTTVEPASPANTSKAPRSVLRRLLDAEIEGVTRIPEELATDKVHRSTVLRLGIYTGVGALSLTLSRLRAANYLKFLQNAPEETMFSGEETDTKISAKMLYYALDGLRQPDGSMNLDDFGLLHSSFTITGVNISNANSQVSLHAVPETSPNEDEEISAEFELTTNDDPPIPLQLPAFISLAKALTDPKAHAVATMSPDVAVKNTNLKVHLQRIDDEEIQSIVGSNYVLMIEGYSKV